jgi:hypothetical protein
MTPLVASLPLPETPNPHHPPSPFFFLVLPPRVCRSLSRAQRRRKPTPPPPPRGPFPLLRLLIDAPCGREAHTVYYYHHLQQHTHLLMHTQPHTHCKTTILLHFAFARVS